MSGLLLARATLRCGTAPHSSGQSPAEPAAYRHDGRLPRPPRASTSSAQSPANGSCRPGPLRGKDIAIEPDLSNAAPFLAAAMVAGGSVSVTGWPAHSTQPGAMLGDILSLMGARVVRRGGALTVSAGSNGIQGVDLDLSAAGELTPTIVGLAAFADSPTTLYGIGHIRGHETDRDRGSGRGAAQSGRRGGGASRRHPHRPPPTSWGALARTPRSPPRDHGGSRGARRAGGRDRRHRHDRQDDARVPRPVAAHARGRMGDAALASGGDAGIVDWLDDADEDDDEFDEADVGSGQTRRPTGRARSAAQPTSSEIARLLGVDRGRYAVLIGGGQPRRARVESPAGTGTPQAADRDRRSRSSRRRHLRVARARCAHHRNRTAPHRC